MDTSGTTMSDTSDNSNDGTSANSPSFANDQQGNPNRAMTFNGTSDKVTIGDTGIDVKTVSFWINADDVTTRSIIDMDGGTRSIEIDGSSDITATGFTSPIIYINGSSGDPAVVADVWEHVVVTTATAVDASSLVIGNEASWFDGDICNVRIYDDVLTPAEALLLY
ncbi:unnamed protein product, partial [marine sediment metagenome]